MASSFLLYFAFLEFKHTHMFCFTFDIIPNRLPKAPTGKQCPLCLSPAVSGLALLTCCQRCQPPMETHIIIITVSHCLPPGLSVCLALSWAVCFPWLVEQQSHCWLTTLGEGGNSSKNQGSILPIRKLRNTQRSTWKQRLRGRRQKV